jgi:hypothetical protein
MSLLVVVTLALLGWIALSASRLLVVVSESNAASKEQVALRTRMSASCRRCRFFERLHGAPLAAHQDRVESEARGGTPIMTPMSAGTRDLIREADVGRCHRFPPPGSLPKRRRDIGEMVFVARQLEQALAEGAEAEQQIRNAGETELFDSEWQPVANRFPLVAPHDWCGEFAPSPEKGQRGSRGRGSRLGWLSALGFRRRQQAAHARGDAGGDGRSRPVTSS